MEPSLLILTHSGTLQLVKLKKSSYNTHLATYPFPYIALQVEFIDINGNRAINVIDPNVAISLEYHLIFGNFLNQPFIESLKRTTVSEFRQGNSVFQMTLPNFPY